MASPKKSARFQTTLILGSLLTAAMACIMAVIRGQWIMAAYWIFTMGSGYVRIREDWYRAVERIAVGLEEEPDVAMQDALKNNDT